MAHKFLAPSAAHIWGAPGGCRAYPLMAQMYPEDEDGQDAKEGTAAHEIAARMIESAQNGQPFRNFVGQTASNGVLITSEIQDSAEIYARDVATEMSARWVTGGDRLRVERPVDMPMIHPEHNGGTPDCALFDDQRNEIIVWDFKHGFAIVEEFENWQLLDYAAGLVRVFGFDTVTDQNLTIRLRVVQPRAFHPGGAVREWALSGGELRGYVNILAASAAECMEDDPVARTGDHCRYCPARHACGTLQKAATHAAQVAGSATPRDLDAHATGVELHLLEQAAKLLEYRITGLKEQAEAMARRGERVTNYTLEPQVGRLAWTIPDEEVLAIGDMMGVDLRNIKPITPTQARDRKLIDASVINEYSARPSAGFKLVPDNFNEATKVFKK